VIHYHGGPIWPTTAAVALWTRRHGMTSFAHPAQVALMFEVCQSAVIDCGAFTTWRAGEGEVDSPAYHDFVRGWEKHPGFDWALIDDEIEGDEHANDARIEGWLAVGMKNGVPVWHLHESLERLQALTVGFPRVALGSSGQWATPGTEDWWRRMEEVREVVCDELGRPKVKLHGLRMLSPTIFSHIPLSSADSCNVALNIGKDVKWSGTYQPLTAATRALVLAERIEQHAAAVTWSKRHGVQMNLELIG
jgi:hypothetical protein